MQHFSLFYYSQLTGEFLQKTTDLLAMSVFHIAKYGEKKMKKKCTGNDAMKQIAQGGNDRSPESQPVQSLDKVFFMGMMTILGM